MEFKELYKHHSIFKHYLTSWAENQTELGSDYYIAKKWLDQLLNKSKVNDEFLQRWGKWLTNGSTILLKECLFEIGYNEESIEEFNAMCLMDNTSCFMSGNEIYV